MAVLVGGARFLMSEVSLYLGAKGTQGFLTHTLVPLAALTGVPRSYETATPPRTTIRP
jgi:hypothetical protein